MAEAAGLAGGKLSGSAAGELAGYVAAAPGLRMFSGDDSNPAATMRAGGAGVISGRSSAYPEVYAALVAALGSGDSGDSGDPGDSRDEEAVVRHQLTLDRIVGLGASIGRLKHALALRGLGGTTARMTVDPPDASLSAAIAAEVAALLFRSAVNQGPGSRVQYSEVRRKRGAGPQIGSVIVRVPGSRPGESGAPDMWPV